MKQDCFWILVYIIEELMPRDYYSNMLARRADIQIIYKIVSLRDPELVEHFAEVCVDMSLITVESFLTIYTTTCHPDLTEVVMDHFLLHGPTVLLKAMVLLLSYMRKDLLNSDNLGMIRTNTRRYIDSVQREIENQTCGSFKISQRSGQFFSVELPDKRTKRILHYSRTYHLL